jgi:hypothetical protein
MDQNASYLSQSGEAVIKESGVMDYNIGNHPSSFLEYARDGCRSI